VRWFETARPARDRKTTLGDRNRDATNSGILGGMTTLLLKPGRERSLLRRHPWIFSGAISSPQVSATPGETVDVRSAGGAFLARAAYSPSSQIRARVWTFDEKEAVDEQFLGRRIESAVALRRLTDSGRLDAVRLIHAESDGLPGLVVDRYGKVLVMQSLSTGIDYWKETISQILVETTGAEALYERSDAEVRSLEGLTEVRRWRYGSIEEPVIVTEHGIEFEVDITSGQKTGFYLDQRENRSRLRGVAEGRTVLDGFCFTGGFALNALSGGAKSVTAVDSSQAALELLRRNAARNGLDDGRLETTEADLFALLRTFRDSRRVFDLIILDPPKLAPTVSHVEKAARAYKDLNLLAFKLLAPGGFLFTFSCSGGVDEALFGKIVAGAALDAGADARIIARLSQGPDHPVGIHFPEGAYLKGLVAVKR
jgi:23S rRNA (cytosine1962-C5)-methyltransferase